MEPQETLLEFPCQFPIKIMGANNPGFRERVIRLISEHVQSLKDTDVSQQTSSNERFLSLTVTIEATSREHLDNVYQSLTGVEEILVVL